MDALAPVIVNLCRRALLCLSCILDQLSLFYEDAFESTPQDLHALQVVVAVVMIPPIWSTSSRYLSTYGIPVGKNNQRSLPPSPLEVPDHVFPALAATRITPFLSAGVKPNKTAPSSPLQSQTKHYPYILPLSRPNASVRVTRRPPPPFLPGGGTIITAESFENTFLRTQPTVSAVDGAFYVSMKDRLGNARTHSSSKRGIGAGVDPSQGDDGVHPPI